MLSRQHLPLPTTLIIASYNQPRSLPLVLEAVANQSHPVDEIIIADDGSARPTFEAIERCQARLKLPIKSVITQADRGFRKSRILNKAILLSTGKQLLFLDGDIITPPTWVARHVQSYRPMGYSAGAYIRLGLDQSRDILNSGLRTIDWSSLLRQFMFSYEGIRRYLKNKSGIFFRAYNKPRVAGGNLSVDRGLLFGVNGFDERYSGFGGEDADLRNRMNNYGGRPTDLLFPTLALHLHRNLEATMPSEDVQRNYTHRQQSVYSSSKRNIWAVEGLAARKDVDQILQPADGNPGHDGQP